MIRARFPVTGPVDIIWPTTLASTLAETCVFLSTLFNVEISFSIWCEVMANAPSIPSLVSPSQVIFWVGTHTDLSSFATRPDLETSARTIWACHADVSNNFSMSMLSSGKIVECMPKLRQWHMSGTVT